MIKFGNMRSKLSIILFLAYGFALYSCGEDVEAECDAPAPSSLRISVQPKFGASDLFLDSIYTSSEGYLVKFTDLKFYLHEIRNESNALINAALFDYRERSTLLIETLGEKNKFTSLQANLGVGSEQNHSDPTLFSSESWLNISNSNDMHWDWNPGYIFVKIEGKTDTIPDAIQELNHNFVFHCGLDENLQMVDFTGLDWIDQGDNLSELKLKLDLKAFLQGTNESIDLKSEFTSHSAPSQQFLTLKVMQNFKEALMML
jgi:hypothetical protein